MWMVEKSWNSSLRSADWHLGQWSKFCTPCDRIRCLQGLFYHIIALHLFPGPFVLFLLTRHSWCLSFSPFLSLTVCSLPTTKLFWILPFLNLGGFQNMGLLGKQTFHTLLIYGLPYLTTFAFEKACIKNWYFQTYNTCHILNLEEFLLFQH